MKNFLLVVSLLLLPTTSSAIVTVTFDHSKDKSTLQSIDVSEGSYFEVEIINTCADKFEANYTGLERREEETDQSKLASTTRDDIYNMEKYIADLKGCEIDKPILLKIPHDPKYGGYRIDIVRKDKPDKPDILITAIKYNDGQSKEKINSELKNMHDKAKNGNPEVLKNEQKAFIEKNTSRNKIGPTYFVIKVNDSPWHVDFAGGFTVSRLTDHKYGVSSSNTVFRNKSAEDQVNLGFTGFIHTYHDKLKLYDVILAPLSLGLGINSDSKLSFFVGPSLKLGKAFFTVGWNWGPMKTLPAGVSEGSTITDPNTLNNLPTRTGGNVFIGLSYTFLGTGQAMFQKPFAAPAGK